VEIGVIRLSRDNVYMSGADVVLQDMNPGTDTHTLLIQKRDEILSLAHRRGAKNIRVFGSVATKPGRTAISIS